jgi:hypothetical protein
VKQKQFLSALVQSASYDGTTMMDEGGLTDNTLGIKLLEADEDGTCGGS